MTTGAVSPFLKWAGGKRWLARVLAPLLQSQLGTYIEPFLGGGAVFFAVQPDVAILADANQNLINAYTAVRDDVQNVIENLTGLLIDRDEFNRIRDSASSDSLERAVQFLYLNRTAFNGLYRVNRDGRFNVPFGCRSGTTLCNESLLRDCSRLLENADLHALDFRESLAGVRPADRVYVDPPYTVRHDTNGFKRYNERIFSWDDQVALAAICNELVRIGAQVVVTNAFNRDVISLYDQSQFRGWELTRSSRMAAKADTRGPCRELLLVSTTIPASPMASGAVSMVPITKHYWP